MTDLDIDRLAEQLAERLRPDHDDRNLLSCRQAADRLGIQERTVRDLIAGDRPALASVKVGGARRIEPAALDAYIAASRRAS